MKTLLSYTEAAAYLTDLGMSITPGTLKRWKAAGKFNIRKLSPRKVRIPISEIDRLIKRSEIKGVV